MTSPATAPAPGADGGYHIAKVVQLAVVAALGGFLFGFDTSVINGAVDPLAGPGSTRFGNFAATGPFPAATAPFQPDGDGTLKQDMRLNLPLDRLDDRRALLAGFDELRRGVDAGVEAMEASRQKAFSILLGGIGEAFDLGRESAKVVERYDTSRLIDIETPLPKPTIYPWEKPMLYWTDPRQPDQAYVRAHASSKPDWMRKQESSRRAAE